MIVDVISFVLLALGAFFVFMGGLGALRLPDLYTRMHAASLTDSLGTILTLGGIMLQSGWSLATVKLLTILFFLMMTGPTASYALANAALLSRDDDAPALPPATGGRE
ncbi:MAG: monovalent cation/H(+) antiporter subunit G [Steroidobacteraceae bacterium]